MRSNTVRDYANHARSFELYDIITNTHALQFWLKSRIEFQKKNLQQIIECSKQQAHLGENQRHKDDKKRILSKIQREKEKKKHTEIQTKITIAIKEKKKKCDKVSITKVVWASGTRSIYKSKHIQFQPAIFINIVVINKLCYYIKTSWLEERVMFFFFRSFVCSPSLI